MKRILGSLTLQTVGATVKVTLEMDALGNSKSRQTKCNPRQRDVVNLVAEMRGHIPDDAVLRACGDVAREACRIGENGQHLVSL